MHHLDWVIYHPGRVPGPLATPMILNVVLSENLIFFRGPPPKFGANPTHLDPTTIKAQKTSQTGKIDAGTMYDWSILGVATLQRLR